MVVQDKKIGGIRICAHIRKLNDACLHDPFPTPFTYEVLDNVGGHEAYSSTNGFSGYHQIKIVMEDRHKTTFVTKWGHYQYTVVPFRLKNALIVFSIVVVASFKEFIHKFLEVYLVEYTMFSLLKGHVENLRLMLDIYKKFQILLNLKKCVYCASFGILMGHVICKQGLLVDPITIAVIFYLPLPTSVERYEQHWVIQSTTRSLLGDMCISQLHWKSC
jgi:hypothetical protein